MILNIVAYMNMRCFIPSGNEVARTALMTVAGASSVHFRCALGQRDVVRAVPSVLYEVTGMEGLPTQTSTRRVWMAESRNTDCKNPMIRFSNPGDSRGFPGYPGIMR
jgi:hypothetical protein